MRRNPPCAGPLITPFTAKSSRLKVIEKDTVARKKPLALCEAGKPCSTSAAWYWKNLFHRGAVVGAKRPGHWVVDMTDKVESRTRMRRLVAYGLGYAKCRFRLGTASRTSRSTTGVAGQQVKAASNHGCPHPCTRSFDELATRRAAYYTSRSCDDFRGRGGFQLRG